MIGRLTGRQHGIVAMGAAAHHRDVLWTVCLAAVVAVRRSDAQTLNGHSGCRSLHRARRSRDDWKGEEQ